jgi:hypothetical protein
MKLLIITSVQEYEKYLPELFKKAEIKQFSSTNIKGYNSTDTDTLTGNWFSSADDDYELNSSLYFTFTSAELIEKMMEQVTEFNLKINGQNPIHAIVLGVEKFVN